MAARNHDSSGRANNQRASFRWLCWTAHVFSYFVLAVCASNDDLFSFC